MLDRPLRDERDKPLYRVPSMTEIAAVPWNGCNVISLFAGCGGSSLGYRMAGFRILWASEFVPAAYESYQANKASHTKIDGRDIRTVKPDEILAATGLASGELDVLDGSPPCQAFSTAGRRAEGWGKNRIYEHGARQKNEELFTDYIRILRGLMPRVFVAENVSGLAKGVAKGFFLDILADLKASGYRVVSRLLDAQWLGVPQTRKRVIFIGARDDLGIDPIFPQPLSYRYSVRDACPNISMMEGANGFNHHHYASAEMPAATVQAKRPIDVVLDDGYAKKKLGPNDPMRTIRAGRPVSLEKAPDKRKFTIAELKRLCAFPDDFVLTGSYAQQWERLGNSVPPLMMRAIAEQIVTMLDGYKAERRTNGSENTRSKSQADGRAAQAG
jgi:DNA (cytosine-5)-methyltransferase 1